MNNYDCNFIFKKKEKKRKTEELLANATGTGYQGP